MRRDCPYSFLKDFKSDFSGEWPTLPDVFRISARRFAGRPCFSEFSPAELSLTYGEALQKIESLADWLSERGVQKGDCVAVSGKNSVAWAAVYFAALFAGAIVVPLDFALRLEELENLLAAAKPKLFFVDEEKFDFFAQKSPETTFSLSAKFPEKYAFNLEGSAPRKAESLCETDIAAILFTSGTTGTPKGVMLSHKNLVSCCFVAQWNLRLFETDVFYALLPIHHAYTMQAAFIEPISVGASVVFGKSMAVSRLVRELKDGNITMFLGVPMLFNKLLAGIFKGIRQKGIFALFASKVLMGISYATKKIFRKNPGKKFFAPVLKKVGLDKIRVMISGGGPLAPDVFRRYNELGLDFIQGYGLTETSPILTLNPVEKFKVKSVGRFPDEIEVKIESPNEKGEGEILVRGPMVSAGYLNMPKETSEAFTADGFFRTGDLGRLDGERYLYLCGRAKNLIVTEGGKNVYPEEIENEFQTFFDEIAQITVVGYSDEKSRDEKIEAQIYPADGLFAKLGLNRAENFKPQAIFAKISELVSFVNKKLQPYARISKITILPKPHETTTTQKVKRNAVSKASSDDTDEKKKN